MKINYYDQFACIADKCSLTCCQEWKIAVDDATYQIWEKCEGMTDQISYKEGGRVITLNDEKKCPYLDNNKLCKLVIENGDQFLSKTCQEFPRQIRCFEDHKEYSLAACCPKVIDMIKEQKKIYVLEEPGERSFLMQLRSEMMDLMGKEDFEVDKTLLILFYLLLEIHEEIDKFTERKIQDALPEYFKYEHVEQYSEVMDGMKFDTLYTFTERNELFLDLAENYRKEGLYSRYLSEIAKKAEEISECDTKGKEQKEYQKKIKDFQKEFEPYKKLFRNYLTAEIYASSISLDETYDSMILAMEWIAMEYATMEHVIFLDWLVCKEGPLVYERVRDYMAVVSRMMGYDEEDIFEYLKNSFECAFWDWGYFALVIGNEGT